MKELIVAAIVALGVSGSAIQNISPDEVAEAIKQGLAGKTLQKKCEASGDNGFDIVIEGPMGRIMRGAREAKRDHRQFTEAEVTPALKDPVLTVAAQRDESLRTRYVDPMNSRSGTAGVNYRTDVVLRSKASGSDAPILLKPVGPIFYDLKNAPGYRVVSGRAERVRNLLPFPGSDMTASFDLAAFRAIPRGDVEIVVFMTDAGEHRCKISDKDRLAIR